MIFGCPRCRYKINCKPYGEVTRLIMRHSEMLQKENITRIYEAIGLSCKMLTLEKRKEEAK